jgi:hypothetical protein
MEYSGRALPGMDRKTQKKRKEKTLPVGTERLKVKEKKQTKIKGRGRKVGRREYSCSM